MAVTQRLNLRQQQSLVMTPQLQQAIKLLQFSNMELAAFVQEELDRNPLLEAAAGENDEAANEPKSSTLSENGSDAWAESRGAEPGGPESGRAEAGWSDDGAASVRVRHA